MAFTLESFRRSLDALVPAGASGLLIAYSGGLDSTVLLHAAAALRAELPWPVRATHIDHQLHPDSAAWGEHSEHTARSLGIGFERQRVALEQSVRHGIEAAARHARYAAFGAQLRAGEVLLTAHQADDQAETLLLALMRGTGARGLAGMALVRRFAAGWHARPLLPYRRAMLETWAREHGLEWIDDPSNQSGRFARNYLRAEILPRLEERWPAAVDRLQITAGLLVETSELLDELAQLDLRACGIGTRVDLEQLAHLSDARQRNLLRWWLRERGARAPSRATLAAMRQSFACAAGDRSPHVDVDDLRIFRHRHVLYAEPIERLQPLAPRSWRWREPLPLGSGLGRLRAIERRGEGLALGRLPEMIDVRFRLGGERLRRPGARIHRTLKHLLQEANVLPWWREQLPLLCVGERLCAVADVWIDADAQASAHEPGVKLVWEGRPEIFAVDKRISGGG